MENMTTFDHAEIINKSIINGKIKQAVAQFKRAVADDVSVFRLLEIIEESNGSSKAFKIADLYIDGSR